MDNKNNDFTANNEENMNRKDYYNFINYEKEIVLN